MKLCGSGFAVHQRDRQDAADNLALRLIKAHQVAAGEKIGVHGRCGRGVHQGVKPQFVSGANKCADCLRGAFKLSERHIARLCHRLQRFAHEVWPKAAIGAGVKDDAVLGIAANNDGRACGKRAVTQVAGIYGIGFQHGAQLTAKGIVAHLAYEAHWSSKSRGGHCLVGSLAAGSGHKVRTSEGFSCLRHPVHLDAQVHVHAAAYDELCHSHSFVPVAFAFTLTQVAAWRVSRQQGRRTNRGGARA